jgi:hypothetical protein
MPIIVPRKVVPIEEAKQVAAPPGLTEVDVQVMLAQQAEMFDQQLKALQTAFSSALSAASNRPKDRVVTGWDFAVEYDSESKAIKTIRATAREGR